MHTDTDTTGKHRDRLLCLARQCQGNMACCIRAVSSGCPIMMFKFCMACPAAPLSKLSRTAAASENQQSDAARTLSSSPCCRASQEENSLCCKAKASNTLKSHVSTQQAFEARCPCLHSQSNLHMLTTKSCTPSCCNADCLGCLTSPTVLINSQPTSCLFDCKRCIPAMTIALPGNLSGKTLIYVKLDPRTCRVCGI